MSVSGQIQAQIDLAVAAAVAPLVKGIADLTKRVSELEHPKPAQAKAAPARGVTARAGTAGLKAEAHGTK